MLDPESFEMFLFATEERNVVSAVDAGISGLVVDWETDGKYDRQKEADTQINWDSPETLRSVRSFTDATILCRINGNSSFQKCKEEIRLALAGGASEILLPMVRTVEEVESVLEVVDGRCGVGILIETQEAVELADALGTLPLSRVYVGLNDLAIDRKSQTIFSAMVDGTVDYVRKCISVPFGVAGLTLPGCGDPIPSILLFSEMARLQCSFTFLRRSFTRDICGKEVSVEVPCMKETLRKAFLSSAHEKAANHEKLRDCIYALEAAS